MRYRVIAAVTDLLSTPKEIVEGFSHNNARLTQLIYGEEVHLLDTNNGWAHIAAVEQLRYGKQWEPYTGWLEEADIQQVEMEPRSIVSSLNFVHTEPLSYGSWINIPPKESLRCKEAPFNRKVLIEDAKKFLKAPYLWGGKSSPVENRVSSVDCSGLVHLLYRGQGVLIPRDAHDQYLASRPTSLQALQVGDLLFTSALHSKRITHVLIYLGEDCFMEATESFGCVQKVTLGKEIEYKNGLFYFHDRDMIFHGYFRSFNSSRKAKSAFV